MSILQVFGDWLDKPEIEAIQITCERSKILLDTVEDGNRFERWTIEPKEDFDWEGLRKDLSMCILERIK